MCEYALVSLTSSLFLSVLSTALMKLLIASDGLPPDDVMTSLLMTSLLMTSLLMTALLMTALLMTPSDGAL